MTTTLAALAEPHRQQILAMLLAGPRPVSDLVEALPVTQPAVSKHLKVLREAGLVAVTVDAQRRLYSLNPEPLEELDGWLAPFRELWTKRLDALERHLIHIDKREKDAER
jgi:DNA-binding transcriptional ArsR family regulator